MSNYGPVGGPPPNQPPRPAGPTPGNQPPSQGSLPQNQPPPAGGRPMPPPRPAPGEDPDVAEANAWADSELKKGCAPPRAAWPIVAMLIVFGLGGMLTWNLATAYGWTQSSEEYDLRTGTMQVQKCQRDAGRLFVMYKCTGTSTFAPQDTWSATARRYLAHRDNVTMASRTDLTGKSVPFFSSDQKSKKRRGVLSNKRPTELAFPADQRRAEMKGATLWVPLASGLGTLVGGIGLCALLLRLLVHPMLERQKAAGIEPEVWQPPSRQ